MTKKSDVALCIVCRIYSYNKIIPSLIYSVKDQIYNSSAEVKESPSRKGTKSSPGEIMRLFIADDSEILRERLADILSEIDGVDIIGHEGNATRVLETVDMLKPDLVILDIQMPEGNGILILEAIKKKEKPPLVIMFTNYPYLQYRKRCMDAGADYFFYKSTEFEKLLELIRSSV